VIHQRGDAYAISSAGAFLQIDPRSGLVIAPGDTPLTIFPFVDNGPSPGQSWPVCCLLGDSSLDGHQCPCQCSPRQDDRAAIRRFSGRQNGCDGAAARHETGNFMQRTLLLRTCAALSAVLLGAISYTPPAWAE